LSRSLLDFARIMGLFDKHGIAFVSVTQQFNTNTSMGRLILNVLLSFAQFEREMISERTRDKIAATRRKGKWSGGYPVLGYDVDPKGGRLLVNEAESAQVEAIFRLYADLQRQVPVLKELSVRGWTNKRWINKKGKERGGKPFHRASLHRLLTNVLYAGKLTYKDEVVDGEHPAIISPELFERVQSLLRRNGHSGGASFRNKHGALLRNLLVCGSCNCAMVHAFTQKRQNRLYRYYVCHNAQKKGWDTCPTKSVPAQKIEQIVIDQVVTIASDQELLRKTLSKAHREAAEKQSELKTEEKALARELKRFEREIRTRSAKAEDPPDPRLCEYQERLTKAERRLTEVRQELAATGIDAEHEDQLSVAFREFTPVWNTLSPREQARVVRLLVERVTYDRETSKVALTFRASGLREIGERLSVRGA